jgi:predicted PhzF superfamily epimerase YddE/YHI9
VLPAEKTAAFVALQGARMGRPSYMHVAIAATGPEVTSVRVGGEAVLAGEGTLYV